MALLALRASATKVVVLIGAVLVAGAALRGYQWLHIVAPAPVGASGYGRVFAYMPLIYYPTWTRLDGLLAGVVLATIQTFRPALWSTLTAKPNLLLIAGLIGVGISILFFKSQTPDIWTAVFG